jgi:hypothetical protein
MTVLITLTTAGADSGPFNLYTNLDGYVSAFATGVSKSALLAGYSSSAVLDFTTTIRVKSTGDCVNYIDITLTSPTTTTTTTITPTTTTTTTLAFSNELSLHLGLCADVFFPDYTYYVSQTIPNVVLQDGDVAYFEPGFITPIDGLGQTFTGFFNSIKYQFVINNVGVISSVIVC